MNALTIFLAEFWPTLIGVTFGIAFAWYLRRSEPDKDPLFIDTKSFPELSGFGQDMQKQLLKEASKEAHQSWVLFFPVVIPAAIFSAGVAFGRTLPKVTTIPNSWWDHAGFAAIFAAIGIWLAGWLEARLIRPFLKASIERTHDAA